MSSSIRLYPESRIFVLHLHPIQTLCLKAYLSSYLLTYCLLKAGFESRKIKTGFTGPQSSIIGSSKKPPWSYALSQIFTYCLKANARYGYLITDQELVVIKIRPICPRRPPSAPQHRRSNRLNNPQPPSDEGELKYKSIPWTHNESDKLTINFALWALHLMAAKDGGLTEDDTHTTEAEQQRSGDL